ncbi:MAG: beta-glucuronidase [Kiritimatiellales bacterium]|nr:beta-glucuronidase [Kiritimatiellales bacterium]
MLYPQESETRDVKDLSGIWKFKLDGVGRGLAEQWYKAPLADPIDMPVPSSFNEITPDKAIRDHVGEVWYERHLFVSDRLQGQRVCLRFGSAEHTATVWVNGTEVAHHVGGFLPFEADISDIANFGGNNRITVMVNNVLTWDTLPTGYIQTYDDTNHPEGFRIQQHQFDFYNYAGLNRQVLLTSTPKTYIEDILIRTDRDGKAGIVHYSLDIAADAKSFSAKVSLFDEDAQLVAASTGTEGSMTISNVRLWKPGNAYLYEAVVEVLDESGSLVDIYRLSLGVRSVKVTETQFLINDEPFYFQGCCKHEDMDVKGRGFDHAMLLKDFYLMEWIGANSTRTSHYPYSEEFMQLCDRKGIVVIDEVQAVGMRCEEDSTQTYNDTHISSRTLAHHKKLMAELIKRDKNHPCVVMWNIANEPIVNEKKAGEYFAEVAATTRELDPTRPVSLVTGDVVKPEECYPFEYIDVMCINRYHSWYSDPGHTELIEMQIVNELTPWHEKWHKPLIVSEYGTDTIAGMHALPAVMFTEEYQCEALEAFHRGFDRLPFMIGEHVWNFADFATKQGVKRVVGNKKGVFTRQRQPKAAAFLLRKRWAKL